MKKINVVFLSLFSILLFSLIGGASLSAKEKYVFRYATQMPKTHHLTVADYKFAKLVEERTDGHVKIDVYPAGQLYKSVSLVKAVTSGAIEMGTVFGGALTGPIPLIDVFDIPFQFSNYDMIEELWNGKLGDIIRKSAEKRGLKILSFGAYGDSFVIINNKRPIKDIKDMGKMKIRTNTPMAAEAITVLGGTPLRMSSSEVYAALQRGIIDGASTGLGSVVKRKWYEVARYATITSGSYSVWPVFINLKVWNKLPFNLQAIIQSAAIETQRELIKNVVAIDQKYTAQMKEKMEVHTLSITDMNVWQNVLKPVGEKYAKRTGAEGADILAQLK